ncbi:MAG: type I glyceraldehyde-3-phosphate dehydrogenase [Enterobacterales bacterium]|nr:type I glyceraldehyde-3-phosphate dehydrogenase [Enterobacterales bacterium]
MINVAINGYGRIGRNILRALYEGPHKDQIRIIAINDLASNESNVHLTKYDTIHGRFSSSVSLKVENDNSFLMVDGDSIQMFNLSDPENLPWKELAIDLVLECTGFFKDRDKANKHIKAGAKKVIVSAPGKDLDATIVYGVNHDVLNAECQIISNASCTTNCLAPVAKILNDLVGIESGLMTTIHAYTNDQRLIDSPHSDIYRARAAAQSMIPTKTGAAQAVGLVLPELEGKFDGMAIRVPTINVSLVDLTFIAQKETSTEEINQAMKQASENQMKGVLNYVTEPLVSIDFNHDAASSSFDPVQTKVLGKIVKIMAWYDNEWGYSNRMLDTTIALMKC